MRTTGPTPLISAISGFFAVAIGAFGRHAISDPHARELVTIGAQYHVVHTMAAIATISFCNWGAGRARLAAPFFLGGVLLFSGSLYALALGAPRWLGVVTPIGGVCFLIGWALMVYSGYTLYAEGLKQRSRRRVS